MPSTPSWSDEIRTQYLSGAANTFVLHGNVQDRLLLPANGDGQPARIGNLTDFLVQHQLRKFDLVLSYELGSGVRVELGAELFRKLRGAEEPPREPAQAVGYLDYLLRFLVNLRKIRPGETPPAESGVDAVAEKRDAGAQDEVQPRHVAVVIDAITGRRARRVGHHAGLLVIADGFEIAARAPCQFGALQSLPGNVIGHGSNFSLSL